MKKLKNWFEKQKPNLGRKLKKSFFYSIIYLVLRPFFSPDTYELIKEESYFVHFSYNTIVFVFAFIQAWFVIYFMEKIVKRR